MLVALIILTPPADFIVNVWPPHLDAVAWRYAAEGLFTGSLLTMTIGFFAASWLAMTRERRGLVMGLGICYWVLTVLCVALAADFFLNALQMRGDVVKQPGAMRTYDLGTLKGVGKYLISAGFLAWLALAGHRWSKEYAASTGGDAPIIVSRNR